jgi:hypothetical protein
MNRPFALLGPMIFCSVSQNPDREAWNTVERMCGKAERLRRIPVKGSPNLTEGKLQLGRVITVD